VILRDTSVIFSEGDPRIEGSGHSEIGHNVQVGQIHPHGDKTPVRSSAGPARTSRAKRAQRRIKGPRVSRRWLLVFVGIFGGLLGLVLLVAAPGATTKPSGVPVPQAGTVAAADSGISGVSVIPASLATAVVPRSSVTSAKKPAVKKTAAAQPVLVPTVSASTGSSPAASAPTSSGGTITAGDSKANCINAAFPEGVLTQSVLDGITSSTGVTYNCINTFANPATTWSIWEQPWMFSTTYKGYAAWLAASSSHQVIMAMDLIPQSVSDDSDSLTWEQACASGDYDQYATTLAKNLVSYGAGSIVIRLGPEANGSWEADYVGTTSSEMTDWAKCYANEVTAMRAVAGTNFLFVWNPNICTADIPISEWYPGNSYVDIIGADAYDEDCLTLKTVGQEGWETYSTNSARDSNFPSLANIESFAAANRKPMAFPEWGLTAGEDDPAYVTDLAQMFHSDDFAYESYFDPGTNSSVAKLGSSIPQATAAYARAFG
jgi:hypothetical protein